MVCGTPKDHPAMAFLRRKSGVYHEDVYSEDFDVPRNRRRLSKPSINSTSNLPSLSQQQRRKSTGRTSQDDASPFTPDEFREFMKAHSLSLASDLEVTKMTSKGASVALLAARFEKNSTASTSASASQHSLLSAKTTQRPLQSLGRKTSVDQHDSSSDNSWGKLGNIDVDGVSPMSSFEHTGDDSAPPARRNASFVPGAATRAPNQPQETIQEETASLLSRTTMMEEKQNKALARTSTHDEWSPPPQNERSVTPSDLEYAHIGRLGLGSLRVVNGTASPAPSDMFKLTKNYAYLGLRRDCSSVYAESEVGTIKSKKPSYGHNPGNLDPISDNQNSYNEKPGMHRAFSFNPESEAALSPSRAVQTPKKTMEVDTLADSTGCLADEYIAELPTSPYALVTPPESPQPTQTTSPVSTVPGLLDTSLGEPSLSSQALHDSPPVTPASQGSVVRHTVQPDSRNLFYEEVTRFNPGNRDRSNSPASFFSMPDTDNEADHFKSAVEIQSPRSRSKSPQKMVGSPLKEFHRPTFRIPRRPLPNKSDSGYCSEASTSIPPPMPDASAIENYRHLDRSPERRALRFPFRKAVQSSNKPVLIQPTPSTKVPTPSTAQIESISALTSVTSLHRDQPKMSQTASEESISPTKTREKLRKKLQKPRRKSAVEPARELVVQRIVSMECFDIPVVSNTARTSLAQRAETIPELTGTYKTQEHTVRNPNASNLTLARPADVEFPAPAPEKDEHRVGRTRSRSKTRRRSLSRPRSWFGWSKEEKVEPRSLSRAEVSDHLNDFGTVVGLLGTDPYDIARAKPAGTKAQPRLPSPSPDNDQRPELLRRRTSPSNMAEFESRPRSMMDDESAQKVAKQRRLSNAEKRAIPTSRHSFDDRGGIPGKIPQSVRLSLNAPPLPPIPTPDEINRRYSRKIGLTPSTSENAFDQERMNDYRQEDVQSPHPQAHSPTPEQTQASDGINGSTSLNTAVYTDQQFHSPVQQHEHEAIFDEEIAPPPPSHSPHPIDITERTGRQRDVSWTGPANAWYARRRSASANLQDAYIENGHYQQPAPMQPYADNQYAATYDYPDQEQRFAHQQDYPAGYDADYYEDPRPYSQQNTGEYESWNGAQSRGRWEEEQHYQYRPRPQPRDYYPDNSGYNSYNGSDRFQPRLIQRHTWQPTPQGYENNIAPNGPRFYAEYNKANMPYPQHFVDRRSQTYDEYQRPVSQRSKQSRSRSHSRSRPTSRHSHYSRPTSRHSHHSQSFNYPVEEMPYQSPRSNRSPQQERYSGRTGYDPRLLPARFDDFADEQRWNSDRRHDVGGQRKKKGSWLDMEAYGIDFEAAPVRQIPVRSPVGRMTYG